MSERRLRWLLAAVVLVAYNTWLLGPFVGADAIFERGLMSELAADSRPWQWLFRTGDVVVGAIVVATALCHRDRWTCITRARALTIALLVTGLGIIGDAVFNLNCSPTLEASCHATGELTTQPWEHQVHAVTSFGYSMGMLASLALVAFFGRGRWRPVAAVLLVVQGLANAVLAASDLLDVPQLSWFQMVSIVLTSGWLAALVLWGACRAGREAPR